MATSVICRPLVRERDAMPLSRPADAAPMPLWGQQLARSPAGTRQSKRLSVLDPTLVGDVAGKFTVAPAPY